MEMEMEMDLDLTPTKSAEETDPDTPPRTHTPSIKNHLPPPPPPPPPAAFKECMKNHAANIGGHAVDGCGEYMPPPSAAAANPISLICAACGCHRNFHRRDPESPTAVITPPFIDFRRPGRTHHAPNRISSPSPPLQLLAEVRRRQEPAPAAENLLCRKRSRTKFSQEQKEMMHSFSEKLGWKMHKSDEAAVAEFCRDAGVGKGVLKVWMHNNKNTLGARKESAGIGGGAAVSLQKSIIINGGGGNGEISRKRDDDDNGDRFRNGGGGGIHFHDSNNGSSSSA